MLGADNQGSFLNRFSLRRNQFTPTDTVPDQEQEDLELLQKHVADRFTDLLTSNDPLPAPAGGGSECPPENTEEASEPTPPPPSPPPFLSIAWFRNLLDVFLCCEAEFKAFLLSDRDPSQFSKPPLDRLIPDLLDRCVKALDICNAINHGIDLIQHWQKLAQIAMTALRQAPLGEGQVRRARKALTTLLASMSFDDKENTSSIFHIKWTDRTVSVGRRIGGATGALINKERTSGNFRSLSWSVAKSWSSAKQIQNMSANLGNPRGAEVIGPPLAVYIMNTIVIFVMWAFIAGIPCQERNGLSAHLQLPRNVGWAHPISLLQERIGEDWKKKEKKGTSGLLEELRRMQKVAHAVVEFADGFVFPVEEEKAAAVAEMVSEMAEVCRKLEEGLGPLQLQVREVFHRIVRSRAEILDVLEQSNKLSTPLPY